MGTINYKTSNYITIGYEPIDILELEEDKEFMQEMQNEVNEYGGTIEEVIDSYIRDREEDDYWNAKYALDDYTFDNFKVSIEPGYYEGFSIEIEDYYGICLDSKEKKEINKEITRLKNFLIECANCGLRACYPSWGTKYEDYKGTIKAIGKAVKAMREEVSKAPSWHRISKEA